MRLIFATLCLITGMSATAQSVSITPFSPNGIPFQLYAGGEAVFIITNLPNNSTVQMRYGRIKKINESTYSITENKCDLVFRDTLEIRNDDGFYKTIPFNVAATEMNDSALYVRYRASCSSILTKEEFLRDETLYIMPATSNYQIDSFTLILLPERGEYITFSMIGNKPSGTNWQRVRKSLKSGDRLVFNNIYCSRYQGREKRVVKDISIRIK